MRHAKQAKKKACLIVPSRLDLLAMDYRKYLSKIGKKGGAKRGSHPLRIEMARNAALTRWNNAKRMSKQNQCQSPQNGENK